MLENLFAFPIVMVDGEEEQRREEQSKMLDLPNYDDEMEVFVGQAELPYYDFLGILDRWGPTKESKEKARNGEFDHCMVMFHNAGTFMVPWPKKKFKDKLQEFAKSVSKPSVVIKRIKKNG